MQVSGNIPRRLRKVNRRQRDHRPIGGMMEFHIIIDDDSMTPEEREEFAEQLRNLVHNEWWSQFSATVIGPFESPVDDE
jgi:hypothetical protein